MQDQTLRTLAGLEGSGHGKVFNKLRMTVFPKWYIYNHANPVEAGTAYEIIPGSVADNATAWGCQGGPGCPRTKGSFDFTRFNVSYWRNYERREYSNGLPAIHLNAAADATVAANSAEVDACERRRCGHNSFPSLRRRAVGLRLHGRGRSQPLQHIQGRALPEVSRRALCVLRQRLVEHG
jgi:hypothetical protein